MLNGFRSVNVIGLGYIGLPTAAILASRGLEVVGVEINAQVVRTVNSGQIHIVEPDLHHLVRGVVSSGHLTARGDPTPADAFIIAVPTPTLPDHKSDLAYV